MGSYGTPCEKSLHRTQVFIELQSKHELFKTIKIKVNKEMSF